MNVAYLIIYVISMVDSSLRDSFLLIEEESTQIEILQKYIDYEYAQLGELEIFQKVLTQSTTTYASEEEFASNPLAIYKVIKYLSLDFDKVRGSMVGNGYYKMIEVLKKKRLPDMDLFYGEIRNLINLKRTYNLTIDDIMTSQVAPNVVNGLSLTSEDCFLIGKTSAERYDHEGAIDWLEGCREKFDDTTRSHKAIEILILSFLFLGDKVRTRELTNKFSRHHPKYRVFTDLNVILSQALSSWQDKWRYCQWECFNLCAGEYDHELAYRKLKCRYNHHNSLFLVIAPLKEEILSFVPKVSLFRDVVHESEIELLKMSAFGKLRPAADKRHHTGQRVHLDNQGSVYDNLRKKLQDISNLTLKTSKTFQIIHYIPGAFIREHNDYGLHTDELNKLYGHRKANALIYLSDVPLGGNTVFPHLRLSIQPAKGSVLLWPNMKVDGSKDLLTEHAGCPVIFGEKIVCTQWFRMTGQDHWITKPEKNPVSSNFNYGKYKKKRQNYKNLSSA